MQIHRLLYSNKLHNSERERASEGGGEIKLIFYQIQLTQFLRDFEKWNDWRVIKHNFLRLSIATNLIIFKNKSKNVCDMLINDSREGY